MSNDKTLATAKHGFTTGHCQNNKQPGGCQLHNLQCGWPNCDRRAVEPSLATAKHGGCVQLGDGREMLRKFGEGRRLREGSRSVGHDGVDRDDWEDYIEVPVDVLNRIAAALSAQPSPGGQGELLEQVARFLDYSVGHDPWPNIRRVYGESWWEPVRKMRDELRALAVRQPVGATVKDSLTVGGGQPVGEIVGHMDPDAEFLLPRADGCVLMGKVEVCLWQTPGGKYTKPLYDAPAQAVDLGQFREAVLDQFELVRVEETHTRNAKARIAAAEKRRDELLALIDSQAVGNG